MRALRALLRRRARAGSAARKRLDRKAVATLFRRRAIVFTDSADFTLRTAQDGILHFLMLFERLLPDARKSVAGAGGEIVKLEADSFLLRFDDVTSACRGVLALEAALRRLNRGRPANERLRFSYGIGFGDVVDLEHDVYGLEVNLASRLGEDRARPGEALLTPAAAAALDGQLRERLSFHESVRFLGRPLRISRLALRRP
jgi:class 3 adenylate cyclase